MKILLIILVTILFSCKSKQGTKKNEELTRNSNIPKQAENDSMATNNSATHLSFIDSVSQKYELSTGQIKKYTKIDSVYYTDMFSDVSFIGDTVIDFHSGLKGAIIKYDDRKSCIYKFLLIIDQTNNRNSDNKIIFTDCDHDESADYTTLRYRLLNDSTFETIETYIPAKSGNKANSTKDKDVKWKINMSGMIVHISD